MEIARVGTFRLGWGESLVWDDRRQRLYFVDCGSESVLWIDGDSEEPSSFRMPTMPTGIVPTEDGRLVVVLVDGLHLVDVDARTCELLAAHPAEIDGRCNDACADLDGNLITGKLNFGPEPGSAWRYAHPGAWSLIDPDISNTNGPGVAVLDGESTLVIGDTAADYFAYSYDPATGQVGPRRVFGATSDLDGHPDGTTFDAEGGLWCALFGGGQLARFTTAGLDRTVTVPVANPTDVTFGGAGLDRLYVVSIDGVGDLDGSLLVIDGLGVVGRPEPRFRVDPRRDDRT